MKKMSRRLMTQKILRLEADNEDIHSSLLAQGEKVISLRKDVEMLRDFLQVRVEQAKLVKIKKDPSR